MTAPPTGIVYRDACVTATFLALSRRARLAAEALVRGGDAADPFDALIAAGDYEGALADAGAEVAAREDVAALVDGIADGLARATTSGSARAPSGEPVTATLTGAFARPPPAGARVVKRPEGFAYYALRPEDVLRAVPGRDDREPITVVGIRTIGTVLSALCAAGLRARCPGRDVRRVTIRPGGQPFDRRVQLRSADDDAVARTVRARRERPGTFLIVDEGPGLSGSSFLAVAEWLASLGVLPARIVLYGDHVPEAGSLCAPDADRRWRRFRSAAFARSPRPGEDLGGGRWRSLLNVPPGEWPAAGPLTDREKRLVLDQDGRRRVEKFEGLGGYGRACAARAAAVAEAGFGPAIVSVDGGLGVMGTALLEGRRPRAGQLSSWAERIAAYCAFRARSPIFQPEDGLAEERLQEAMTFNAAQELGAAPPAGELRVHRPLVTDGRLQPWEWVATSDGELWKTDASAHGDDHLLPGPTDIAWDLAGVLVEWGADDRQRDGFLARFGALTGDRDLARVCAFEVAYAACAAAALSMALGRTDEAERPRLIDRRRWLRDRGRRALRRLGA
jgi:hypothetical protein